MGLDEYKNDLVRLETLCEIREHVGPVEYLDGKARVIIARMWEAVEFSVVDPGRALRDIYTTMTHEYVLEVMEYLHALPDIEADPAHGSYMVGWNTALSTFDEVSSREADDKMAHDWACETFPNVLDRSRMAQAWKSGYRAGLRYCDDSLAGAL